MLVLDGAGWHGGKDGPGQHLAAHAPTLRARGGERLGNTLPGNQLSNTVFDGYPDIVEACCDAWNALTAERLRSLTAFPWITRVTS